MDIINESLITSEGFLNPIAVKELESAIRNMPKTYSRFNNDPEWNIKRWVFVKDITSYIAKWAVSLSPHSYPERLDEVIKYLHACLIRQADKQEMMNISLCEISKLLYNILYEQGIEAFDNWNKSENPGSDIKFLSRDSDKGNSDDDFIDLDALLHNVTISLRDDFRRLDAFNRKFKDEYGS